MRCLGDAHDTQSRQLGESKGPDSEKFDKTINDQKGEVCCLINPVNRHLGIRY